MVRQGQVLAVLEDKDLQLERLRWESELEVSLRKEREAMAKADRVALRLASAQANQARAQLDLTLEKLGRVQVTAPFDGIVVQGDLSQQLGSPVDHDFYADTGTSVVGMGETGSLVPGSTTIHVPLPTLHPSAPTGGPADEITIKLKHVLPGGQDEIVATSTDAPLDFDATAPGAYRAEIWMVPNHLTPYLGPTPETYLVPTPWILTNHLYLQ
ncbi:MAG TPA: hypothetical protein PL196_03830, partial [Burkholderiaceae bacterium]|nr:hypothetical protein [Burkholderiaceae bacterium]